MAKKNSKKKVGADEEASAPTTEATTEISTTTAEGAEDQDEEQEVYDLIHTIDKSNEADTDEQQQQLTCRMEGCNAAAVAVWKANNAADDDTWPVCEPCQEQEFGGWPVDDDDDEEESAPLSNEKDDETQDKAEATPCDDDAASSNDIADSSSSNDKANGEKVAEAMDEEEKNEEEHEAWDLKKIMSIAEVNHQYPIKCNTTDCSLPAAVLYVSTGEPPEKWYSCLDCQEKDFEGWPTDPDELPVQYMTQEHKDALVSKCSKRKDPPMPVFAESPNKGTANENLSNTVTPPPNAGVCPSQQNNKKATKAKGKSTITPSPANALEAVATAAAKPAGNKKKAAKPSKSQLEIHRKWQEAAQALGGPDAKIVVNKSEAKKLIFDFLYDAFAPMNITQIHKKLKAVVPSPVLKACLDDMALDTDAFTQFDDSDDEDDSGPKKKKSEQKENSASAYNYKGSLSFKSGKGSNSSLYYVNYSTAKNGDGFDREEKNKLTGALAEAQAEHATLKAELKKNADETTKLLSEPTNEEATARLEKEEAELMDLEEQVEAARKLKVNEKHKQQIKRRIDSMTTYWRKRRRLCMDFMIAMEENTDGTISAKKCFSGDGQIELDSDEAVAEGAIEYAKKKRSRPTGMKRTFAKSNKPLNKNKAGIPPSESFVAVLLNSQGCVERVHLSDNE